MTNRELLQIIEIDVDFCTLTYAAGACAAALGTTGTKKCFNTFKTCQDTDNFDKGALTLRFCKNQDGAPKGATVFPALQSVSTNATRINIAGIDNDLGALGRRERVSISLQDFTYSDELTDKYRAGRVDGTAQTGDGYDPASVGTFFGKMRARNPFYFGRALRVKNGYVGDDLSAMRTQHYVIDEWSGPDANGNVSIVAKDILSIADNDKAECPKPSSGILRTSLSETSSVVYLTPAGIGATYALNGFGCIGNEIVSFTRVDDGFALTGRGIKGTEAKTHSVGDSFQECYAVADALLSEVVAELLTDYAGIDASYINQTAWDTETTRWLNGLKIETVIPKPTGVLTLLAELARHGVSIWWDSVNQKIEYRLNRLVDVTDTVASLSDAANILEGSSQIKDKPDLRLSQVVIYHGMIDFAGSATNPENFGRASAAVDLESEGADQYDQSQFTTMFSRWIAPGSDSAALAIVKRAVLRYRNIPADVSFLVDAKDVASVGLGGLLNIKSRLLQDDTGNAVPTEMQVIEFEETVPGHRVRVVAQTFAFSGRYGFITENGRGTYSEATDEQKRLGTYISPNSGVFADGTPAYKLF
jgi:hypothetical protein